MSAKPFDPFKATFEEAWALHESLGEREDHLWDPTEQWEMAHQLKADRKRVKAGTGRDVLEAVETCAVYRLVMPEWLVDLFLERLRQVTGGHVASWDDPSAFGLPFPKGTHVATLRRRQMARILTVRAFTEKVQSDHTRPVDKSLWEEIGAEVGLGATRVEELYREALRMDKAFSAERLRRGPSEAPANSAKRVGVRRKR